MSSDNTHITRAQALAAGKRRYVTGKPCPAGHNSERDTLLGECCECRRAWRKDQKQRDRARLQRGVAA